jgi:hypothetical protein
MFASLGFNLLLAVRFYLKQANKYKFLLGFIENTFLGIDNAKHINIYIISISLIISHLCMNIDKYVIFL